MKACLFSHELLLTLLMSLPAAAEPRIAVLKLDDYRDTEVSMARFQLVADYVVAKGIHASFGLIGKALASSATRQRVCDQLNAFVSTDAIEIWNHGYDHSRGPDGEDTEFFGRDLASQRGHLRLTQDLALTACGLMLRTFGAPYNKTNGNTLEALRSIPEIEVFFFPSQWTIDLLPLARSNRVDMERTTGIVRLEHFQESYRKAMNHEVIILQGHPALWDERSFAEFEAIVELLLASGITFMTPVELFQKIGHP